MTESNWYADRRERWRPEHVRLLLIAESAPDDGGDISKRRFFYDDDLTGHDGLFREVVKAIFDNPALDSGPGQKRPWPARLRDEGVFLIDLAPAPVNYHRANERHDALQANVEATTKQAVALVPDGVILIKRNVFEALDQPLRDADLSVLHDEFIPFPGSGQQRRFRDKFTAAIARLGAG